MISTIVPTSSLVYHTASVTLILVAVSNDNNHFHHYSDFCNAGRPPDCGRSCPWRRSGVNQSQAWDVPPGLSRWSNASDGDGDPECPQLVTEYELVTANGECILASEKENSDLFRVLPMSYGTFGFLTRITIRVVKSWQKAKQLGRVLWLKVSSNLFFLPKVPLLPWVRLHYQPSFSLDQTVDIFEKDTRKEVSLVFHSTLLKYHQIATFNQILKNRLETTPWKESRFPKTQQSSWPVSLSRRMR